MIKDDFRFLMFQNLSAILWANLAAKKQTDEPNIN